MHYCEICGTVHEEGHHHHHHETGAGAAVRVAAAPRAERGEAASEGQDDSGDDPPAPPSLGAASIPFPPVGTAAFGQNDFHTSSLPRLSPGHGPERAVGRVIDFPQQPDNPEPDNPEGRPSQPEESCCPDCAGTPTPDAQGSATVTDDSAEASWETARYFIPAMDCPHEEKLIRDRLAGMEGVKALGFDLAANTLTVRHALKSLDGLVAALMSIGMTPEAAEVAARTPRASHSGHAAHDNPGHACNDHAGHDHSAHDHSSHSGHDHSHHDHSGHDHSGHDHSHHDHSAHAGHDHAGHSHPAVAGACCDACATALQKPLLTTGGAARGVGTARFSITNMDCPVEERLIRDRLKGMEGITALEFNLLSRVLTVRHTLKSLDGVVAALKSIDMGPVAIEGGEPAPLADRTPWKRLIAASLIAGCSELAHLFGGSVWVAAGLAVAAILLAGLETYKKGWGAIRRLDLNMNALMSFAVTGAVVIGDFPEAAMVLVLFTLAEALEDRSLGRAREAISGLVESAPEVCTVRRPDGIFGEAEASGVPVGSVVRVRPGERLALDGRILSGASAVNEAAITGESRPAEKGPGDPVYSGTVNESGSFDYETTEPFENSTLARILKAVEEAQATKAPIQRFVDRFAQVYTPSVFAAALLIGTVPPLALGLPWGEWIYRALVTLVIACPCALVISTPVTIVSGLAAATRKGLLVKGGTFLEEGRKLRVLALDKTGTVTAGRPVLTDAETWGDVDQTELRTLGASLAYRSDHPVSKAIFAGLGLDHNGILEAEGFRALPGEGSAATVGGRELFLGNWRLVARMGLGEPALERLFVRLEAQGKSAVALFAPGRVLGVFAAADKIRPESREAIAELARMGVETVMLTGDNESAAASVAQEVGGLDYRAGLLPQDKLAIVRELSRKGKVGMAGDGINDAPALAEADIGFSMGAAGTGAAIETSDVAIMDDDLRKIPAFLKLSRETAWHLWENISFSLLVKLAFIALTFLGFTKMWMAVFADIGVCLIVVANGLRLLKK
ncbi:MAG: heavy metal translocating P-type ATPase [Deltaproteobacteria bacterium]|jgi:Cd2+/Zn2+-exporting ATPase|nr:heavy metal translocating P-type ATPase [Deltaproteobacteria bacterium]